MVVASVKQNASVPDPSIARWTRSQSCAALHPDKSTYGLPKAKVALAPLLLSALGSPGCTSLRMNETAQSRVDLLPTCTCTSTYLYQERTWICRPPIARPDQVQHVQRMLVIDNREIGSSRSTTGGRHPGANLNRSCSLRICRRVAQRDFAWAHAVSFLVLPKVRCSRPSASCCARKRQKYSWALLLVKRSLCQVSQNVTRFTAPFEAVDRAF